MQWVSLRQAQEEAGGTVVLKQHWYLTEDQTRVVEEGDPAGRWLWASPGTAVKLSDAIRLGAVKVEQEKLPEASNEMREHPGTGVPMEGVEVPPGETHELVSGEGEPAEDLVEEKKAKQVPNKARKAAPNKAAETKGEGE